MDCTQFLRDHHTKVTPQRIALVEELHKKGHVDIDTLYANIQKKFPSISLATLYKNINSMLESTLLNEVKISGQKSKYELAKEEHAHMICQKCGKVEDIFIDTKALVSNVENDSHYAVTESALQFFGVCPNCS